MRAIRSCILALSVAACGGESKDVDALIIIPDAAIDAPPDAFEPVFDFSCMGNAQGAAAANVTLGGFAAEVVLSGMNPTIQAAHNTTIDVCKGATSCLVANDKLDTKTTPMMGCPAMGCPFTSASLATASAPLDVYLKLTKAPANLNSYIYPPAPVITNVTMAPGVMFQAQLIELLSVVGITQDPAKGILVLGVVDCANMPISDDANTTLSIKQGGNPVQGTTEVPASMFASQLAGTYLVFNVPAGPDANNPSATIEVGATYKTKTLRAHDVRVFRNSTTGTAIRPGF